MIYTALINRDLLVQKRSSWAIFIASVIMFSIGLILHFTEIGKYSTSGALLCPLITLGQYWLSRKIFLRYFKREPKDTFFIYVGKDLNKDRVFNLLYFIPATFILVLITYGMEKLAKAGW